METYAPTKHLRLQLRSRVDFRWPVRLRSARKLVVRASLHRDGRQGELGWQIFENSESSELQLGTLVGTGSYGIVREASYKGLKVAVKVLTKKRGQQTRGKVLRKLAREIDLLSRLQDCTNVVQLLAVLEDEEHAYLVCELCHGGDLEKLITERGPLTERAAARVVYETLRTVAACHARNVIHGDVKPANFLLRQPFSDPMAYLENGPLTGAWLKSIDFGCSQVVTGEERLTRRTGTPVYMAPEIFQRCYGLEADVWSVGMMFYQLIASRFPFWGSLEECRKKTIGEVMHTVLHKEIPLDYGPWLQMTPDGLDLMQKLTHRVPALRITAAQALKHQWFATQLESSPPSRRPAQKSNIIPRVTRPKPVTQSAQVVDGGKAEAPQEVLQQVEDEGFQEAEMGNATSGVWQPFYLPAFTPS